MDYTFGVALLAAGVAVFVLLKPLRPLALIPVVLAGYVMRGGLPGDWVRKGVALAGGWLGDHGAAQFVPYLAVTAVVVAAVVLLASVAQWDVGVGALVVALAFPALLILSGDSPPATTVLSWLGWAVDKIQTATVTKGTR